jgi:hypothetical protein
VAHRFLSALLCNKPLAVDIGPRIHSDIRAKGEARLWVAGGEVLTRLSTASKFEGCQRGREISHTVRLAQSAPLGAGESVELGESAGKQDWQGRV